MNSFKRPLAAAAVMAAVFSLLAVGTGAFAATSTGRADSGTAYFSITHTAGKTQFAAGNDTDKILGEGASTYKIGLSSGPATGTLNVTVNKVTLFTPTGSLSGTATATLNTTKTAQKITNGKLTLDHGLGSQKGHSIVAKFTGTANLPANQYVFHYQGTYK
jgi:hypothetical protein